MWNQEYWEDYEKKGRVAPGNETDDSYKEPNNPQRKTDSSWEGCDSGTDVRDILDPGKNSFDSWGEALVLWTDVHQLTIHCGSHVDQGGATVQRKPNPLVALGDLKSPSFQTLLSNLQVSGQFERLHLVR
jgi:hypothetical protein